MTKVSLLSGAYTDETADWRGAMPINKEPIFGDNGINSGYLGQVDGLTQQASGYGASRGGINWNGVCYRVMGSSLLRVADDGTVTVLGDVGNDGLDCSLDYSFDRLAVTSAGNLFYWNGAALTQVTDPDLGTVFDVMFVDGVFMMTDGTYLVITDTNDPMSIDPLRYGSVEEDPDPIFAICKIRGEVYALGQYTIQNFQDVGGQGFPFANNAGAIIPRGIVGRKAWCYFNETFAFVGGNRWERPTVCIAEQGRSQSIATQEVDKLLAALAPDEMTALTMDARNDSNEQRLYLHLPDRTLCYMNQASIAVGSPVWITLQEGVALDQAYTGRHLVPCYGKWLAASPDGKIGYLDDTAPGFWGATSGWRFQTNFLYNESMGGILHRVELVGLPGRTAFGAEALIFMSTTTDGETWGQEQRISGGKFGERAKRLVWWPNRRFANIMGIRFRGEGQAHSSFTRLEVGLEGLAA